MATGFLTALRNNMLDEITALLDAGTTGALINIYTTGSGQPATGGSITDQTLLGTLTMSTTSFPAASSGTMTANAITQEDAALASGEATWARITDSDATFVMDVNVSESGGGGEIILNDTTIVQNGTISLNSFTITAGNS